MKKKPQICDALNKLFWKVPVPEHLETPLRQAQEWVAELADIGIFVVWNYTTQRFTVDKRKEQYDKIRKT